ncbi:MAG: hypothetical protein MUC48_02495 [Leptolyngbya sp. Prado105]|jgi:hypothetical protein|nr:hypothetical protein [Leptolyngbya sp. Prado105]
MKLGLGFPDEMAKRDRLECDIIALLHWVVSHEPYGLTAKFYPRTSELTSMHFRTDLNARWRFGGGSVAIV